MRSAPCRVECLLGRAWPRAYVIIDNRMGLLPVVRGQLEQQTRTYWASGQSAP